MAPFLISLTILTASWSLVCLSNKLVSSIKVASDACSWFGFIAKTLSFLEGHKGARDERHFLLHTTFQLQLPRRAKKFTRQVESYSSDCLVKEKNYLCRIQNILWHAEGA